MEHKNRRALLVDLERRFQPARWVFRIRAKEGGTGFSPRPSLFVFGNSWLGGADAALFLAGFLGGLPGGG